MKSIISLMSLFDARAVAGGADGIPLDTFTPAGAQAVVTLFAALGLGQLMTCLVWIVALWCYRALVPLLFALLIVDQLSRKLLLQVMPIPRTGAGPGSPISLVLLALMLAGLVFSLWVKRAERQSELSVER
jgi:hypothetical protein